MMMQQNTCCNKLVISNFSRVMSKVLELAELEETVGRVDVTGGGDRALLVDPG